MSKNYRAERKKQETIFQKKDREVEKQRQFKIRKRILQQAVIKYVILIVSFSLITLGIMTWIDKEMNSNIQYAKDIAYRLYNDGLKSKISCDTTKRINIDYTDDQEVDILYNQGIKNLNYPDLITLKLDDEIIYSKGTMKYYTTYRCMYVEVIVPRGYEADISMYKYQLHFKAITYVNAFIMGAILTFLVFLVEYGALKDKKIE